jgi:hypothetical protein
MMEFNPWEKYPGFTKERLCILAEAIQKGRHSAVADYQPSKGDDYWTLGCVAYRRACFEIRKLEASHDWLKILHEEQNRFTFSVDGIPVKFYKGTADDPPTRSLAVSYAELISIQTVLDFGGIPDDEHILRFAVETDATGEVQRITLVELDGGTVTNKYTIPLDVATPSVLPMKAKAVDVGPPILKTVEETEAERKKKENGAEQRDAS